MRFGMIGNHRDVREDRGYWACKVRPTLPIYFLTTAFSRETGFADSFGLHMEIEISFYCKHSWEEHLQEVNFGKYLEGNQ
jgi:hypothetical protein